MNAVSLTDLVDARVGIVRSCTRLPKDWREPPLPVIYEATLSNFDFRRPINAERVASGKGLTDEDSAHGAVVEALERYCAMQQRPGDIVVARASDLDAPSIPAEELVLYSDRQYASPGFRHRRPDPEEQLTWIRGRMVDSGGAVYAPASLVYMNFAGVDGHERFTFPNSNGLAGGHDVPSAVLAGLCELIERDAFTIAWLARLTVPRIDFSASAGIAADIRERYGRCGVEIVAFDLTTDVEVTVVMAVAIDRSGVLPAATVGLGCDLDPVRALDRALMEIVQVRTGLVPRFRGEHPPASLERYEDVRSLEDHATYAASPDHLAELDFLFEGRSVRALADMPDRHQGSVEGDLAYCRRQLAGAGCTVAFVDLTTSDLEPFPVRIVRAIATGLQPMHFGFGEERLGGRRPFTVPRLLGYTAVDLTEDDLNRCPHPLA